ncbi:unnamed protein product [Jaminaea pallidilutea]
MELAIVSSCAILALVAAVDAATVPTPAPSYGKRDIEARQDAASLQSKVSSIRDNEDAFMESVTKSDSTTALSSATGFACKGLTLGNTQCCDTGIIVNRKCWVVPDAEGIDFFGATEDYVPDTSGDTDTASTTASVSASTTASTPTSRSSTASTEESPRTQEASSAPSPSSASSSSSSSNAASSDLTLACGGILFTAGIGLLSVLL